MKQNKKKKQQFNKNEMINQEPHIVKALKLYLIYKCSKLLLKNRLKQKLIYH